MLAITLTSKVLDACSYGSVYLPVVAKQQLYRLSNRNEWLLETSCYVLSM
jgi:hypothetical protein